jgi:hypothetical protein
VREVCGSAGDGGVVVEAAARGCSGNFFICLENSRHVYDLVHGEVGPPHRLHHPLRPLPSSSLFSQCVPYNT